jgi:hypothetical protein
MDYVKIGKPTERNFEDIIQKAGGRRLSEDESRETERNADFQLGQAIVELKLVNEEGLEKEERQRKIAEIFRAAQPGRPVIVLRPNGRRCFVRAVSDGAHDSCRWHYGSPGSRERDRAW